MVYHLHQCRLAHHKTFCAKVGKGSINKDTDQQVFCAVQLVA